MTKLRKKFLIFVCINFSNMTLLTNLPNPPTNDRENTKMNFFLASTNKNRTRSNKNCLEPVWYMCLKTENCCLKTFVEIRVGEKMY